MKTQMILNTNQNLSSDPGEQDIVRQQKIAHMQKLVDEARASGFIKTTMPEIIAKARTRRNLTP